MPTAIAITVGSATAFLKLFHVSVMPIPNITIDSNGMMDDFHSMKGVGTL